nr:hypothetical protein [Bacteroidota bacterium]
MKFTLLSRAKMFSLALLITSFTFGQEANPFTNKMSNLNSAKKAFNNVIPNRSVDYLWFEGFDGGALPDGWQNVINTGEGWNFATNPFSHTFIYYFADMARNASLVTPMLDLSGLSQVTLGINHRIYAYDQGWT